jgi:L-aspartate oxidase
MEFFQFHPTVLYEPNASDPGERRFLLTEALRGEKMGGIITASIESIEDFILKYDPRGSHATRDKVSQAIDTEMKKFELKNVFLNVTPKVTGKTEEYIREKFPTIYANCLKKGIDITKQPIPIIPAAHYTCGGVLVNINGETNIPGLYAVGEVSYTGLMGANRLASNSLTEAALFGKVVMDNAIKYADNKNDYNIPLWSTGSIVKSADQSSVNQIWDITRNTMMSLCGIARTNERLTLAQRVLNNLDNSIKDIYWNYYPNDQIFETKNLVETARLIVDSASFRKESRGGHFRTDHPDKDSLYESPTIMQKGVETRLLQ